MSNTSVSGSQPAIPKFEHFDPQQQEVLQAVTNLLYGPGSHILPIEGFPGTGKTRMILFLILEAVARSQKVFLCGSSDASIDNVLRALSKTGGFAEGSVVRLGDSDKMSKDVERFHVENVLKRAEQRNQMDLIMFDAQSSQVTPTSIVQSAHIVASTLDHCQPLYLPKETEFGLAIVDEAAQLTELNMPYKTKVIVLFGDRKQLSTSSFFPRKLNEIGPSKVYQLTQQYRMNPSIAVLSSVAFYDGMLTTPDPRTGTDQRIILERPVVFYDVPDESTEAAVAVVALELFVKKYRQTGFSMVILTFYEDHCKLVNNLLKASTDPDVRKVKCLTVDDAQGREYDFVVLSCGRTKPTEQGLGALNPNRINVAITRARLGLVVLFDKAKYIGDPTWSKIYSTYRMNRFGPVN